MSLSYTCIYVPCALVFFPPVVMVIFAIVAVAMWYIRKREREMTAMYIMVEKILGECHMSVT